ncbi:hypothetical protein PP175_26360 (plasmid) [Aneurinibacillus sp. Ricciae_BoGa-3]|uniref:hypothetical protein n=1 Tax=Aneurinibacillus sp. Ricciae_BoGa-3 TaxID=3022697 RepID=UPI002342735A|nr:hypothetical protein [Aneurinibacillus sp. Ricciae_BoGa-3]WCK57591.1 hypothetical protein PP175_26360 [Aneurinibacillus sp. Ricciae_BoGa-3]
MNLLNLPDDIKIKAFNVILEKYKKDTDLSGFGRDVQDVLNSLNELYKWDVLK